MLAPYLTVSHRPSRDTRRKAQDAQSQGNLAERLMFAGVGMFACLTAVAASAIVVSEVGGQEREIEQEEHRIERVQDMILARLTEIDAQLQSLEQAREPRRRNAMTPKPILGPHPLPLLGPSGWKRLRARSHCRRCRPSRGGRIRRPESR
ncbi:hypothetical protein [Krasilnikovia sp. MM14-A1259]|uniref:hypothetical protein n=1 Tax=Krasilnikovia sp. MM14-A1259 TaxID=3373539 RepID=UPI0038110627